MPYNATRQRSFLWNFTWVGIMLLAMGVVFLGVAVLMQLVPINSETLSVYVDGVRRPSTEETVHTFRLVFLLSFGIVGLGLAIAGGLVAGYIGLRRRLARRLKEEGVCITAEAVEYALFAVNANHRNMASCLRCAYTAPDGKTYIFRSGALRINPMPYLNQGQVNVYYDRDDMKRYFVDVDGSVGLGERIVEL